MEYYSSGEERQDYWALKRAFLEEIRKLQASHGDYDLGQETYEQIQRSIDIELGIIERFC